MIIFWYLPEVEHACQFTQQIKANTSITTILVLNNERCILQIKNASIWVTFTMQLLLHLHWRAPNSRFYKHIFFVNKKVMSFWRTFGPLSFRAHLHQASASTLQQLCNDASESVVNNGVSWKWVATPFWSDPVVFNENRIASIIPELLQRWCWCSV